METTRRGRLMTHRRAVVSLVTLLTVTVGPCAHALALTAPSNPAVHHQSSITALSIDEPLYGGWELANRQLQERSCCVVKVSNLEERLKILQDALVHNGPLDVDLRARIQTSQSTDISLQDCRRVLKSVLENSDDKSNVDDNAESNVDATALALHELARGMASMAAGCGLPTAFENKTHGGGDSSTGMDVHCRIVCASNYHAREPPFHTDKAPLRGYVTLKGLGTEYMERSCNPLEYVALRMLGDDVSTSISQALRQAKEMEFIVMKGDYYHRHDPSSSSCTSLETMWTRATACVHRSPPNENGNGNRRRVIISFDLADGDDDREWFQADKKREWRNGLTQRKSRLVA